MVVLFISTMKLKEREYETKNKLYCNLINSYVREWLEECFEIVKSDIIPIRHSEWFWNKDHWECSACGGNRFHDLSLGLDASYCGRCGAKMDIMSR